ncbi:hypothetical protein BJF93_00415 [Xaviernesmea oryzae]|uniref:Uncharacterized protein n=1 Tax=Xaviernesmea oryzae TaxID=464029 RepID=A0A1Q9B0D3_9HYPH|nr:OmpA family protein [Xaviernesmea oryzae]OLP61436.1 hypothetical protein BJF93_00415 [Xaviernesmea oryzae]SEL69274.1 Outer membrane protein OmpA [Xaviernesmea oryzae]
MSNRSRLFASVALPILAATVAFQPALADSQRAPVQLAPVQLAQADPGDAPQGGDNPEELRRKRREERQREQQGDQGGRAGAEQGGRDAGPSDEDRQRIREERRKQREADQQQGQGGDQPQRRQQAAPDGGNDNGPSAEERQRIREERRKQREADQQQGQGGEQPQGKGGDQPQRRQQAAPDAGNDNGPSAEERQRIREERRKQREADQQQNGDQPNGQQPNGQRPPRGGDQPAPAGNDGQQPSDKDRQRIREERRKQREADQQKQQNGDQPDAVQRPPRGDQAAPADQNGQPQPSPEERRKQREADRQRQQGDAPQPGQPAARDGQNAQPGRNAQPDPNAQPAQPGNPPPRDRQRPGDQRPGDQQPGDAGPDGAAPRDGRRAGDRTDQLTPDEVRDLEQLSPAEREKLREERRVRRDLPDVPTQERQRIARDPAKTDDTVVLPVQNGAAVLDSDKDADSRGGQQARERRRAEREQLREERGNIALPKNDADAQAPMRERGIDRDQIDEALRERGRRVERAPQFDLQDAIDAFTGNDRPRPRIEERRNNRTVIDFGDEIIVRGDDRARLRRDSQDTYYEELPRGRSREVIERPNGTRIITIYNSYGDVVQRTRVDRDGREYLMVYADDADDDRPRPPIYDAGEDLPPMRLRVPLDDYIVDTSSQPDRDYYSFLAEPPVERVERTYSIDEVRNSARIRDKVRRIDLDTITFATGSSEVPMSQAKTLRSVADAMLEVIKKDPGETFLIEGHTDAVGSDESNLVLSDERAESVASLLTEVYNIPPENLVTQGYGERYLKVLTNGPSQENRRVTIRRVTPLVRPVAQR